MKHYKYIHIFWHDEVIFNPRIPEMICDPLNRFSPEEHLFVTPHKRVYEAIMLFPNTILLEADNSRRMNLVNQVAPYADWIFINLLPGWKNTLNIKKKYQRKIIWRTWGSEFGFVNREGQIFRNCVKSIIRFFIRRAVKRFYAVGVENIVDEIDIYEKFGKVNTIRYPYPNKDMDLTYLYNEPKTRGDSKSFNIMVGHSGLPNDNHINILKELEKYKDDICLYLPLSYGHEPYMNEVKEYISERWKNHAVVLDSFMPCPEYIEMCSKMDAIILDGEGSYALGNVKIFLDQKKHFYLNRNGVLHRAFIYEDIPHDCTDSIGKLRFQELSSPPLYQPDFKSSMQGLSYSEAVKQWHKILDNLS